MKLASVAAAAVIAAFAFQGIASAKDLVAPQASHAAKAGPRVVEPKRPAKTPLLDFSTTQSIDQAGSKPSDKRRQAPAAQSGIAVNPWIVQNIL